MELDDSARINRTRLFKALKVCILFILIVIYCYGVRLPTASKQLRVSVPDEWFHMVFMVEGENTGIKVDHNKIARTASVDTSSNNFLTGPGTTVIGKLSSDQEIYHGTVIVDELAMWNRALSPAEVAQVYGD